MPLRTLAVRFRYRKDDCNLQMSRTSNSKRNIVWAFINKVVTILGPFIVRTCLVYCLGSEYLGLSNLYVSMLQVLNLAELGFSTAVMYGMYKPIAEGDINAVRLQVAYLKKVYRVIGLVVLVIGLLLMTILDYLIAGDLPSGVDIRIAYSIYLSNTVVSYLMFAYKQALINAYQRNDLVSKISLAVISLQYIAQILLLILIPNFYLYAIVLPLTTIASNCIIGYVADKNFPEYRGSRIKGLKLDSATRKETRERVAGLAIIRICQVTRDSCDSIIISAFLGLTLVACYSNYFIIMTGVLGLIGVIGPAITSAIGNSVASETKEKNYSDLKKFSFIYSLLANVGVSCLIVLYQPFMYVWMGEDLMLPIEIPYLLCLYFYCRTLGDMKGAYVDAAGVWWVQRYRAIVETVSNVVLNILLVNTLGVYGVVLSSIVSHFALNFIWGSYLLFKHYFENMSFFFDFIKNQILYLVIAALICFIALNICALIPLDGLVGLFAKGVVSASISALLSVAIFGRAERFKDAVTFLKNAIR